MQKKLSCPANGKEVVIADEMLEYAVDIIAATHPEDARFLKLAQYVQYGSGPRGLQSQLSSLPKREH